MSTSVNSVTNHFPSAENGFTTTTAGSVSSGATTVALNSVAGYSNGEVVVFVIDPTNAKKQTFTGVVDTVGVQVTSVVWTAGTNVTHDLGATVVDYATATHISMISKGLSVSLDQDGTLKTDAVVTGNITDSNVTTAKIADDAVTDNKLDYPRWHQEIARTTLSNAGDTITVSTIPARKYLKLYISLLATGGTIRAGMTFNSDTGANYAGRQSSDGAADTTSASAATIQIDTAAGAYPMMFVVDIVNITAQEKLVISYYVGQNTAGATNVPTKREAHYKWTNTAAQISTITLTNTGTGDYAIGSEVVVLGHD